MNSGFYLINKPSGITSSDLVLKIKKQKKPIKIGHTGTLDKAAEGLLILPFGDYTSFSSIFLEEDKGYYAKIRFGMNTDSGDREGTVLQEWDAKEVENFFKSNQLKIKEEILNIKNTTIQIPPVISALKVGGKRQSTLFRQGVEFKSVGREISISEFEYFNLNEKGFEMKLKVSSGTYIRKIAIDLGTTLEFPMYMEFLKRTSIGNILLGQASSLEEVLEEKAKYYNLEELISFPWVDVTDSEAVKIQHGGCIDIKGITGNFLLRNSNGKLLAWGTTENKKEHLPYRYLKVFYKPSEN